MCVVSGDRRQRETGWFGLASTSSGGYEKLITPFSNLTAYFKLVSRKIYRLLYAKIYSVHPCVIEIFQKMLTTGHLYESND